MGLRGAINKEAIDHLCKKRPVRSKSAPQQKKIPSQEVEMDPDTKQTLAKAERALKKEEYTDVEELAKQVTETAPQCGRAWELLALAQYKADGTSEQERKNACEQATATIKEARKALGDGKSDGDTKGLSNIEKEIKAERKFDHLYDDAKQRVEKKNKEQQKREEKARKEEE